MSKTYSYRSRRKRNDVISDSEINLLNKIRHVDTNYFRKFIETTYQ